MIRENCRGNYYDAAPHRKFSHCDAALHRKYGRARTA
jgi:hypothetical protein